MCSKPLKSRDLLGKIDVEMKTGHERFSGRDTNPNINVLKFWQWSSSDLLGNATRGVLAEFLVTSSLGLVKKPRIEWDSYDISLDSKVRIEVKSAAKYQSWKQNKPSRISFKISKVEVFSDEKTRPTDIYVFCVLNSTDPLNLDAWSFYVLQTEDINQKCGDQKSISLASLRKKFTKLKECHYGELSCKIRTAESSVLQRKT